jgi:ribosomal protein S6
MAKKNEELTNELDQLDGAEPRVYELGFHLDPELAQEEVKKAYQDIRGRIEAKGTIVAEGEPVKIPLAYTVSRMETTGRRDFSSAFFCWIAYEAEPAAHDEVATMAREDARIVRFLDIRTTVEEAKHAAEMQELFAQQAAEGLAPIEDEVAEVEAAEPAAALEEEAA